MRYPHTQLIIHLYPPKIILQGEDFEFEFREIPEHCVPIRADVRGYNWKELASQVQFDVIIMDPPWQLAGAMPTRGVCLYHSVNKIK